VEISILNAKDFGERLPPEDAHQVNRNRFFEIDHNPLRMKLVVLAGESSIKIWITLPKGLGVAIIEARVSSIVGLIYRIASTTQTVTIRKRNGCARFSFGSPVALL